MTGQEVVVFDLGKVLLDFDYSIAAQGLARQSSAPPQQIKTFIDHSPLLVQYEKGRITRQAFFEAIREMSGYGGSLEEFLALFADVFTPIEPMIELHERLRAGGIPTYIFSNTNDIAISHVRSSYPFYSRFNGYVLSYEHGYMKPEPELYEAVEKATGRTTASIWYLDDRPENVAAGAARGWNAVLHSEPQVSIKTLRDAGLLG